jgi:tRNA A-37 threonylcarbamoyl transferase component Bud32
MSTTDRPTIKAEAAPDEAAGQMLGRYKLLEKIGEGGFGVVYVAEQKEPVKRRVALKIIKLGMDTRQVVARFEAERQALALMDHPNIAKVLDAGATESGRPYFVMELVRGVKLTEYCDQHKLSTKQRLELFIPVCQAIQHAHQKGIIHRDIKPSNILVTLHDGVPVPKVIDFGIAKATQQDLTDKTVYTQLQQFVGTPAYMSPEQAEMSGLDVDTRSDIYSLGVLLYELLTGKTPFDANELMSQGIDAMRKTIREKEPVRPSTKVATLQGEELTTTAARHAAEARKLVSLLRGDLDWIVMKCLEKDRTRRYETANGLAFDLKRHLHNEPVLARPPSAAYKFQKAFRRNKVVFAAATGIAATLVLGVIGTTLGLLRAEKERQAAQESQRLALQSRNDAEKLSNFMLDDFYEELEPSGQFETVARLARRAVSYYDSLPSSVRTSETARNRAAALARWALVTACQGDVKTAMPAAQEAEATLEQLRNQGDQSEGTIYALGLALHAQFWCRRAKNNDPSETDPLLEGTRILRPFAYSADGSKRLKLEYANLLNFLSLTQPPRRGEATCEEALRIFAGLGTFEFKDLRAASAWADTADSEARGELVIGRADDAERLERQVQSLAEGVLLRRPGDLRARQCVIFAPDLLALIEAGRFHDQEAIRLATRSRQAAEDYIRFNPSDFNGWNLLADEEYDIASLLFRQGRVADALQGARAATQVELDHFNNGGAYPDMGLAPWMALIQWEAQRGDLEAARATLEETRRFVAVHPSGTPFPGVSQKDLDEAEEAFAEGSMRRSFGEYPTAFAMATNTLSFLGRLTEISARNKRAQDLVPLYVRYQLQALDDAVLSALSLGRYAEAESLARTQLSVPAQKSEFELRISLEQPDDPVWEKVLRAQAQVGLGRKDEAVKTIEPALAQYREMQAKGASYVSFRQRFSRTLYVLALAQPPDAAGIAKRNDALAEAAKLLDELSAEARQLHDTKELLSWIGAARKPTNQSAGTK